jgi:uncharacterized protein (DUF433 family)
MPDSDSEVTEIKRFFAIALRHPRGRYNVARTSQLSGIPVSTLYEWQRHDAYIPDYRDSSPIGWSYRDLVFLRLLAFLRQGGMERSVACNQVESLKESVTDGFLAQVLYASKYTLVFDDERTDRLSGQSILPFDDISGLFKTFSLTDPISELSIRRRTLWAPDLQAPSTFTRISPFVLAGEPCIAKSRIPTSSIHALRSERGLDSAEIIALYPGLSVESVIDAFKLEQRLRRETSLDSYAA